MIFINIIRGFLSTLYVLISYFINGYTVFDESKKTEMPFRFKVSYVLVMSAIFPFFYGVFIKEVVILHKNVAAGKNEILEREIYN